MKSTILNERAEIAVKEVVSDFRDAVGSTLGPNGNYVIISSGTSSKVTKDGATVAKAIDYDDPHKSHIANIIREAAIKTEVECGDGTTTTTLFACDFFELLSNYNNYRQHKVVENLIEVLIERINESVIYTETAVRSAALISANQDESIANLVCDIVYENKGYKPDITLIEGRGNKDSVERIEGHRINVTPFWMPPQFEAMAAESKVQFYYIDQRLENILQFMELANGITEHPVGEKEIQIFVFKSTSETALSLTTREQSAAFDKVKHRISLFSANIGGGMSMSILEDMAAVTGGLVYRNIAEFTNADSRYRYDGNEYTFRPKFIGVTNASGANRPMIKACWDKIQTELNEMTGSKLHTAYAELLRKRLAALSPLHYIISVGSETNSDFLERKDRFDDVIQSAVTNSRYGVVPGFNTCFIYAIQGLEKLNTNPEDNGLYSSIKMMFVEQSMRLKNGIDADLGTVTDLSTGESIVVRTKGDTFGRELMHAAIALDILDPAYTVISALRGGFRTGQILAKTKAVVVSNRFASVSMS